MKEIFLRQKYCPFPNVITHIIMCGRYNIFYTYAVQHRLCLRVSNLSQPYIKHERNYHDVPPHECSYQLFLYVRYSRLKSRYIGGVYGFRMLSWTRGYMSISLIYVALSRLIVPNRTKIILILTHLKLMKENTTPVTEPYVTTSWSSLHCDLT